MDNRKKDDVINAIKSMDDVQLIQSFCQDFAMLFSKNCILYVETSSLPIVDEEMLKQEQPIFPFLENEVLLLGFKESKNEIKKRNMARIVSTACFVEAKYQTNINF